MQQVGSVIGNIKTPITEPVRLAEKCANCGTLVNFVGEQWRRPCPECGLSITISERRPRLNKPIDCYACYDSGIILYPAQVDGEIFEYAARCICKAGTSRKEKGIPTIDQAGNAPDYQSIAARNKRPHCAG